MYEKSAAQERPWLDAVMLAGSFVGVVVIPLLLMLVVENQYEITIGGREGSVAFVIPLVVVLGTPLLLGQDREDRDADDIPEPFRSRHHSLVLRYLALHVMWSALTTTVLVLAYQGRLEFWPAMTLAGLLLAAWVFIAWFPMRRRMRAVWAEEKRRRTEERQ